MLIYKKKSGKGFKHPTLTSIHNTAKKSVDKGMSMDSVRKILNREKLIYKDSGRILNPCQVNLPDSIKKRSK